MYNTDQKTRGYINEMFILLLPVWGTGKKVQDKRFDSHLTGVRKGKF